MDGEGAFGTSHQVVDYSKRCENYNDIKKGVSSMVAKEGVTERDCLISGLASLYEILESACRFPVIITICWKLNANQEEGGKRRERGSKERGIY